MRVLAALVIAVGVVGAAHAAPGDLDTTFSGDGRVVESGVTGASANAIALQADGQIVVVGGAGGDFVVLRYNRNGTLDRTFGGTGIVRTDFGGASNAIAQAVVIQRDGKILVAGRAGGSNSRAGVARYHPTGRLDTSFGTNGVLTFDLGDPAVFGGGAAAGIAVLPDDRIIVVGTVDDKIAAARLTPDGTLDTTFGFPTFTGVAVRDDGNTDRASGVAVAPDGRVVVAGVTGAGGRNAFVWDYVNDAGLFQFVGNGALDVNSAQHAFFGGLGTNATANAIAIQPDGKVVLAGEVTVSTVGGAFPPSIVSRGFAVARYNADGSMDTTFGDAGLRGIDFGAPASGRGVAIQVDGKIVVVGDVDLTAGATSNRAFAVARLNPDGSLDSTFSGDGLLVTDFGATTNDAAAAVALQANDGRIVAAGGAGTRIALARYHAFACNGRNVTILGTNGADTLSGTKVADVIRGLGGDDTISGAGGDDTICGDDGDDILFGDSGNDTLVGGRGFDRMNGGFLGRDTCVASARITIADPPDSFLDCETVTTGTAGVSGEWLEVEQRCNGEASLPCRLAGRLRVFNPGAETTAVRSTVSFYLSEDDVLDETDVFIRAEHVRILDPGGQHVINLNVRLTDEATGLFVIAVVDALDDVPEVNEANNLAISAPVGAPARRAGGNP